jgi:restriction endonuclease Mrr
MRRAIFGQPGSATLIGIKSVHVGSTTQTRACPECGGQIFEHASYVDGWHTDGDWYECYITSCITCAHVTYQHTSHCSEHANDEHYDGERRSLGVYDEHGKWREVQVDRVYNSAVPQGTGFSPSNYRPLWREHETRNPERSTDATPEKAELISPEEVEKLGPSLSAVYQEILDDVKRGKINLYDLSPRKFEEFIASLFANHGYEVTLTQATRDGGYDVIAVGRNPMGLDLRIIIECKRNRPDRPVELSVARALWGVICDPANRFDRGIIATTSTLSRDAKRAIATSLWRLKALEHEKIINFAGFEREGGLWIRKS